jgi:4-amino-4-deoxy-L-arabinose transferase-like glycosyltransferase
MRSKNFYGLIIICGSALALRIIALQIPMSPWWDPAIYVGMAKFFYSHGAIGLWETLRPPLWPIILGIPWLLGINPLIAGQWLAIASGIATLVMLYIIGEKEERGLGLFAALILALSPLYTFFVTIPTTDIPSALLAVIAAFFILQKRYFPAGVFTALAFLMRFTHGLFLVPFGLFILLETTNTHPLKNFKPYFLASLKKVTYLALGFALLAIPYLIINQLYFGDPLLPLKLGREIIEGDTLNSPLYYVTYGIIDNPILLLSFIGLIIYLYKIIKNKKIPASVITLALVCTVVVGGYISHIGHKELRYSFGFIPFVILIAAYGLLKLYSVPKLRFGRYLIVGMVMLGGAVNFWYQSAHQSFVALSPERKAYYELIPKNTHTITSSPQIMLFSDTKVVAVFYNWEGAIAMLKAQKEPLDYVAIDSEQISCETHDCPAKATFMELIKATSTNMYSAKEGKTELLVFKLR